MNEPLEPLLTEAEAYYTSGRAYYASTQGDRRDNLQHAIAAYQQALQTYTAEAFPQKWANIQEDLTNAYSELARNSLTTPGPSTTGTPRFSRPQRFVFATIILLILLISGTVSGLALVASSNNGGFTCVPGTLKLDGSAALQPLIQVVANEYMRKCPSAKILVSGGASKRGLSDVESDTVQIGNSDIFASPAQSDLVDHQVAIAIFALIANQKVTGIHNLDTNQIKRIYTGVYRNWKQVCTCAPDLNIVAISRTVYSGVRFTFQKYILQGVETVSGADRTIAPLNAVQEVEQAEGSIGYAPLLLATQASDVTILSIDGHAPTVALVKSNTYKFWNIEHMYTKGEASGLAQAFINYMSSDYAKQQAYKLQFLELTDLSKSILDSHSN